VIGFATDLGSHTSHTAIMARALEIPAVVGLHDVSVRVSPGDTILMMATRCILIVNPTRERLERYGKIAEARQMIQSGLESLREQPALTRDGYHMLLSANIELPSDVDNVLANGAHGVGPVPQRNPVSGPGRLAVGGGAAQGVTRKWPAACTPRP
jgi:phosphotransferase system enzyme I (PtsI)